MAKQENDLLMRNTRGMVGNQIVFKRRLGVSYVVAPPTMVKPGRKPTDDQASQQMRFKDAVIYGKAAASDPATVAMYQRAAKRGLTAFNVAFGGAYHAPEVREIIVQGYAGDVHENS